MRVIGNVPLSSDKAEITAVASGALATGDTVVVNSDGTVSAVAGSATSVGSKVTFESASSNHLGAVYDPNTDKVVVFYRDLGNSYYGTAAVGTISGTSISFGTPVVFYSNNSQYSHPVYDANSTKIVNYFSRDPDNYGMAIVGTVSGTSISFGTAAIYATAQVRTLGAAYASHNNSSVVFYRDEDAGDYGKAVNGTVSGTSISFGSTATVLSSATAADGVLVYGQNSTGDPRFLAIYSSGSYTYSTTLSLSGSTISVHSQTQISDSRSNSIDAVYDSNVSKFLVVYSNSSNLGKSKVGSISGTTASYGTETAFTSGTLVYGVNAAFNSTDNRVSVVSYDANNSRYIEFTNATISGTSVSYDTPYVTTSKAEDQPIMVYDSNADKMAVFYVDNDNSGYGASIVYQAGSTNLTANNYIGFAKHGYADTQRATIQTGGAVNKDQTGLTAGQTYYVQNDGSLSTTAGDPSVVAGTAISSTEIIVKG